MCPLLLRCVISYASLRVVLRNYHDVLAIVNAKMRLAAISFKEEGARGICAATGSTALKMQ
jgi:hypothetical protein